MSLFDHMVNVGIDLGTTNSVVSVFSAGKVEEVKVQESPIVPSCVYQGKKGGLVVGKRAYSNRANYRLAASVLSEFKRRMGESIEIPIHGAGVSMSPEQLSAEVLNELREQVEQRYGQLPPAAVITVPAMFEQPQRDATARAGELAGFAQTILLQEPVAAAAAYGLDTDAQGQYWVVFDYGGGTFDASLISVRDGALSVIKNAGDNYLGGADLDQVIVDKFIVPNIQDDYALDTMDRNSEDPIQRARFTVLGMVAEQAKKELSTDQESEIFVEDVFLDDDGDSVDVDLTITRKDFESLIAPNVQRAIEITKELIASSGLATSDVSKIILVGGTTFVPYVREQVKTIGIPVDHSKDPMTVVSRGAAVFASTKRLSKAITEAVPVAHGSAKVILQYEAVGTDTNPPVMGKIQFDAASQSEGASLEIARTDGEWRSEKLPVRGDGKFMTAVRLGEKGHFEFELLLRDASGSRIPCVPERFGITVGTTIAKSKLTTGLQIGLADGSAAMMIPVGSSLPAISEVQRRKLVGSITAGSDDQLLIPILSGDEPDAESNLTASFLKIEGKEIDRDLPEGTDVEITAEIKEDGRSSVTFTFPLIDFTKVIDSDTELDHEAPEVMQQRLSDYRKQLETTMQKATELQDHVLREEIDSFMGSPVFTEIEVAIGQYAAGDGVAAGKARNRLVDVRKKVLHFEGLVDWPSRLAEYEEARDQAEELVQEHGDDADRSRWNAMKSEASQAIANKDPRMLQRVQESTSGMMAQMAAKDPEFWKGMLAHLYQERDRMRDQNRASALFSEGLVAVQAGDSDRVRGICHQLIELLPPQVANAVRSSGGAGVL